MEINEKTISIIVGCLCILGYFVNILKKFFKTQEDVKSNSEEIKSIRAELKAVKESEIKELEEKVDYILRTIGDVEKTLTEAMNKNHHEVKDMFIKLYEDKEK